MAKRSWKSGERSRKKAQSLEPMCLLFVLLGWRSFAGLELFLGTTLQAGFLFGPVDTPFFEDFVFCRHRFFIITRSGSE
jgi:hypothetical protein